MDSTNINKVSSNPIAFDVFLNGKNIDTIFYSKGTKVDAEEVKQSLINHDGYDSRIEVKLVGSENECMSLGKLAKEVVASFKNKPTPEQDVTETTTTGDSGVGMGISTTRAWTKNNKTNDKIATIGSGYSIVGGKK